MVDRYSFNSAGEDSVSPDGHYVAYEDYAELERQRDALVKGNAELIKFIKRDCWIIDPDCDEYFDAAGYIPGPPQTDAVLREIGDKAVDGFIDGAELAIRLHCNPEKTEDIIKSLTEHAQQLREGKV